MCVYVYPYILVEYIQYIHINTHIYMKKNNLVDVVTLGFLSVTVFSGDSDKE